jgi:hypothetical protein
MRGSRLSPPVTWQIWVLPCLYKGLSNKNRSLSTTVAKTGVTLPEPSEWAAWYKAFVSRVEISKMLDCDAIDKECLELEEPREPERMLMQLDKVPLHAW